MRALISTIILVGLFVVGCGTADIGKHYDFIEPNTTIESNIGFLKIHTFKYTESGEYADDAVRDVFKGYTVYTKSGEYVQDVNKSYMVPGVTKLPVGEYIVVAELYKNIVSSFPVKIEKGKMLEIDDSMIVNPLARN